MLKFCAFLVILLNFGLAAKFPSDLPNCIYGDVECIKDAINEILPRVKNGYPALNIVPLNPLEIDRLDVVQETGTVTLKGSGLNLKIYGLSDMRVTKVIGFNENPAESKFEIHGELDRVEMSGNYIVNGRLFVLPLEGEGRFNITGLGTTIKIKLYSTTIEHNNKVYIQLNKFSYRPKTKKVQVKLTYNDDEIFGRTLETFLNENWSDIYNAVSGELQQVGGSVGLQLLNNVLRKVKYSDFFKKS